MEIDKYAVSYLGGWVAGLVFMMGCYEGSLIIAGVGVVVGTGVACLAASWSVEDR